MKQSRRDLLIKFRNGSALLLLPWAGTCSLPRRSDQPPASKKNLTFFTIENQIADHPNGHIVGGQTALHFYEPIFGTLQTISLPMKFPHSIIRSPHNSASAVIAPREESLALVVDLANGKVLRRLELANGEYFYGHGFFEPKGTSIFLTGSDSAGKGFFREFDSDFNPIGDIDTFGESPHDCALIDGGKTIVVANTAWHSRGDFNLKKSSSISYIDFASRKLVDQIKLPMGYLAFQHLVCLETGDLIAACDDYSKNIQRHGGASLLAYRRRNGPLEFLACPLEFRKRMAGNALSIAWDVASQTVVTTTPNGPLTVWSLKSMSAIRQKLDNRHPHGVTLTEASEFLVTTANSGIWRATLTNGELQPFKELRPAISPNISAYSAWTEPRQKKPT